MGAEVSEVDFCALLTGVFKKHDSAVHRDAHFEELADVRNYVGSLNSWAARRLIAALEDIRKRWRGGKGLNRDAIRTPPKMLRAIWASARARGVDKETLGEMASDVSSGETRSTGHLTHLEAGAVLDRLNGKPGRVERIHHRGTENTERGTTEYTDGTEGECEVVEDLFGGGKI
jgi:hypothetical protein